MEFLNGKLRFPLYDGLWIKENSSKLVNSRYEWFLTSFGNADIGVYFKDRTIPISFIIFENRKERNKFILELKNKVRTYERVSSKGGMYVEEVAIPF